MTHIWRVSRRGFLVGTAWLTGTSLALGPSARAATPKTLRIASGEADGLKGTLDPIFSQQDVDATRISLVYERLVTFDESFAPQPQLAVSWSPNETGDTWTFKLRENVLFSDGAPLTAKDVIYTFDRLLDPKSGSPGRANLTAIDPKAIEAVDDHTLRFHLAQPIVEFPSYIANRFTYIVRAGQSSDDLRTKGIGTGPFRVEHFVPGEDSSHYVKNDKYWRPGLPKVDAVEVRSISDPTAQVAAIASGEIDVTWDLPRVGLGSLQGNADVKLAFTRTPYVMSLAMWADTPPFDDARVRQAMKYVVDREKMVQLVLGGHGQVGDDQPVAPFIQFGIPDKPRARDIEKAKALLAAAGHGDGLQVDLHTSEAVIGFIEMATVYQAMASEAGITVNLVKTPAGEYWDNIWLKKPFTCSSWSGRAADEALSIAYLSKADWNETHWRRPEFDALIFEARKTVDTAKRGELYQKAERLLRDDGGAIIPMFPDAASATRANVSGWKLHPQKYSKDFSQVELAS
ncbi:MAG: ABC transporter substrate-binding protein [Methylobacteriaceae bacterium]|nr:ABC transporter substrate-binding protein [Methylobacteriaceae bacterium]MBV9704841.1 ABC transporter substrate-binding protein [Methylobacteriaceae bacterium]